MALGTLATIALATSAAAGVKSARDASKARKEQQARLAQQQLEAREAAKLREVREDTGAEVLLGSSNKRTGSRTDAPKRRTVARGSALGGAGGLSTSKRIGL